ncbi:MAG: Gfo/Idh/MocA family oxidoreductase [Anaerolineae bacterium]|nr:Gfo/Idh/MocA family oxidoreductase [Anaerolineae bacterium]
MTGQPTQIGIIGCGAISGIYLQNAQKFDAIQVAACADLRIGAAQARAEEYGVPKAYSVEELLADPEIEIVLNLTPHRAHGEVGIAVLKAGKSVYNEKPLAVYREEGQRMLALAREKGLRVGGAPDTFLGGAWQTARKLIDDGVIGEPVAALICLQARVGPRRNRRQSDDGYVSFYQTDFFEFGVTWIFDRGPYYLNAIINLLGPARRVTASARKTWEEREGWGGWAQVKTPTHVAGVIDFANGAVGSLMITSDVYDTGLPHIEVYGSEGSLRCIDPNLFGGQLYLRRADGPELIPVESQFGYNENSRGLGVADMAAAIRSGRPHRASGEMAYHVIDIVHAFHEASQENRHVELTRTCERPAPLPVGLAEWSIDD